MFKAGHRGSYCKVGISCQGFVKQKCAGGQMMEVQAHRRRHPEPERGDWVRLIEVWNNDLSLNDSTTLQMVVGRYHYVFHKVFWCILYLGGAFPLDDIGRVARTGWDSPRFELWTAPRRRCFQQHEHYQILLVCENRLTLRCHSLVFLVARILDYFGFDD